MGMKFLVIFIKRKKGRIVFLNNHFLDVTLEKKYPYDKGKMRKKISF